VEKAEGPRFLSVGPVPDSQRATLSSLDPSQKRATLRSGGGRPLTIRSEKKLMNFASAATEHPAFARELPRLSPKCDVCFRPTERDAEYRETDEDEFHYESPAWAAERVRQFATIKDLLTADTPGTS
jgi:hypothetical protein